MATSTPTDEQRELFLIGKVEMRIALTDTDAKLESQLKTYLAPLLLKLSSTSPEVRNKVVTICQHISTRVRPQSIQLPVAALIKQYKESTHHLVRTFDLVYIQQGVGRLTTAQRAELLPVVAKGIAEGSGGEAQAQVFNLFLRLLESFVIPPRGSKEDVELRTKLEVSDRDTDHLATWLGRLLLLNARKQNDQACPGLKPEECSFLDLHCKEDIWNPSAGGLNLLRTKILAAKLLASGLFTESQRFLPALYASSDSASSISDVGDDMMKRTLPATDLEDERLLRELFDLYFGDGVRPRVKAPVRMKILGLLSKSTNSTTFANSIMRLVDDGLGARQMDGEDTVMGNGSANPSSTGREATKLRSAIFAYINFVARYGPEETLNAIAPRTVSRLRDFIDDQGWPKPGPNEDLTSRGYGYEVIGLLSKAGPRSLLVEDEHTSLDVTRWLFDSLARDTSGSSIVVSIEESLSSVLSALSRVELQLEEQASLEGLLTEEMVQSADLEANKRIRSTRYTAVRFANRCLPYDSVKARWVDVLGMGASKDRAEVREEGERGLSPYWYRMLNGSTDISGVQHVRFPSFTEVTRQFFSGRVLDDSVEAMAVARLTRRQHSDCFWQIVSFVRRTAVHEALRDHHNAPGIDQGWERMIDTLAESGGEARLQLKQYFHKSRGELLRSLEVLVCALFEAIVGQSMAHEDYLTELLALAPDNVAQKLVPFVEDLVPVLLSNNHARRSMAARVFGLLASHPSASSITVGKQVAHLMTKAQNWPSAVGADLNQSHGAILALGFYYSRAKYRGVQIADALQDGQYLKAVVNVTMKSTDSLLREGGHIALGQLSMFQSFSKQDLEVHERLRSLVDRIYDAAKNGNEPAIFCLGQLSMTLPEGAASEDSDLHYIETQLYKLHEIRQAEAHFAVGEAFSYLAASWQSSALSTKLDIDGPKPETPARVNTLGAVLERILKDCVNTKPALKKASVMWLLCLVQFCGDKEEVQSRLANCQLAFKRCLSDRDELVQETASRGLGLVYEKGDRSLKDDLVRDLVSSFSSDKQSQLAGNVSSDTQLFEPGALPTGDGSVTTYKDIMSLAAEVGDSSLVYRFMSMASSNAIWSSRAAFGRFGLSNVLSDSSVDGYLADNPKLYPKLFRYRFDPNQGVQRSMNDIWNALVKDSSATIDKHFDAITEDLLTSILGKEWRVRQASCAAIADLVQGRSLDKYEQYLERIWTQCFKVLDDIKESVRAAAASLARVLTGVLTRSLESDTTSKHASAMLKNVLPFLLSPSGLESSAKEVQTFAVHTLLEIVKKSSAPTLRPFIPELVERLLGLLSSLEPEAVNYIHLNADKYNLTEQKIDDMRLSSVRSSPLTEAIERCLDLLDPETMTALRPRLENAMKSAVGLPSKVGASRALVSLATRRTALFKPFADDFLKVVEKCVQDRNETVASSYAVAAGYVARGASDRQILRTVQFAKKLYFESEGDREAVVPKRSIASGEILHALSKHASDRFDALASATLPFVFVAKHDTHALVRDPFVKTWDEAVGGSRTVLLYLNEILNLATEHLDSPQWTLKHTSARAVTAAVGAVVGASSDGGIRDEGVAGGLWVALEKALGGKTWDGKEVVLEAFVKFVKAAGGWWGERAEVKAAVVKIATREAKRQNASYRPHAIRALGDVAKARGDIDMSATVLEIAGPLLQNEADVDAMEVDGETSTGSVEMKETTRAAAASAVLASINCSSSTNNSESQRQRLTQALALVANTNLQTPAIQRSVFTSLTDLFKRLREEHKDDNTLDALLGDDFTDFTPALKTLLQLHGEENVIVGSEALRLLRAEAVVAVRGVFSEGAFAGTLKDGARALSERERSGVVKAKLERVLGS